MRTPESEAKRIEKIKEWIRNETPEHKAERYRKQAQAFAKRRYAVEYVAQLEERQRKQAEEKATFQRFLTLLREKGYKIVKDDNITD